MSSLGPFQMINHRFEVACEDAELRGLIAETLASVRGATGPVGSRYVVATCEQPDRYEVSVDRRALRSVADPAGVIDGICTEANRLAINSSTAPAVLHAGAVERDGRAVVIAGQSGSGKSTLVTKLLGEGWRYLTDEGAQLTSDLTVLPYLKPIVGKAVTVQVAGADVDVPRQHLDPTTFGRVCRTATPVAGLILLGVEPATRARQLVDACKLAFPVGKPSECLDVLADLTAQRPVVCLPARPAASLVARALAEVLAPAGQGGGRTAGYGGA
ncbi:MAG TPA: hypothetical protein VMM13_12135 [Euzebya sp.]|nr:hypothetical protein [Euzebya sp.]